jgi:hypothetical protein
LRTSRRAEAGQRPWIHDELAQPGTEEENYAMIFVAPDPTTHALLDTLDLAVIGTCMSQQHGFVALVR